ncbi:CheR family methyltransferase [Salipiger sp. H15]|uniref:protein-glutamate O-methyltransferase n=1 Tax=Alloyangia sp. H15 TaxID=3029062 RepID=A0AAU8AQS8_9RHOB
MTVAIGSSAGGIVALTDLFDALPADPGVAFVVVSHLDPTQPSGLVSILSRHTDMEVVAVSGRHQLKRNNVYVIPPDREIVATDSFVESRPFAEPRGKRAPIDAFFRSMANDHRDGVAMILSGGGADGAIGVRAVKEAGGVVMVQDPQEAQHPSMPRAAIATGCADFVQPVAGLARRLAELIETKNRLGQHQIADAEQETLRRILVLLRTRTGHDFLEYKAATILRRITRRMEINRIEGVEAYLRFFEETPQEAQALLDDFLISVTTFFRDDSAFKSLTDRVIPELMLRSPSAGPVRVWVAGCATGEEAYSIAMLLLEQVQDAAVPPEIQIFATDLDAAAIGTAREGLYPATIEVDVSPERLQRFFTREGNHYRIRKVVRDLVVFAEHSLLKDPPFSRVDLVSCRNLLIYLKRMAQRRVMATLHFALKADGVLFLGSAESVESAPELFRPLDLKARIFQSVSRVSEQVPLPQVAPQPIAGLARREVGAALANSGQSEAAQHRQALEMLAPPSLLVDADYRILHISDSAGRYLRHPGGTPTSSVLLNILPELRLDLRRALHCAFEDNTPSLSLPIAVPLDDGKYRVVLNVRPVQRDHKISEALVVFNEGTSLAPVDGPVPPRHTDQRTDEMLTRLYEELEIAQEQLRSSRADYESTNEELLAANEELQSINEEYRSTSEELETSREELVSMNEELRALNKELGTKVQTLSEANSDLQNLIAATEGGTLFLDTQMRIRLFTPEVGRYLNITALDVGRSITDFTHKLDYAGLVEDARSVLTDLRLIEREVSKGAEERVLIRFRPYRTLENKIEGVVVSFIDLTRLRHAERALRRADLQFRALVNATSYAVYRMSPDWTETRELDGNGITLDMREPGGSWLDESVDPEDRPLVKESIERAVQSKEAFEFEHRVRKPDGSIGWTHSRAVPLVDESGEVIEWFGAASDITEWRRTAEELAQARRLDTIGRLAGAVAHDFNNLLNIILANVELAKMRVGSEAVQDLLQNAMDAAELGAGFNRRLLSLTGRSAVRPQVTDVETRIAEVCTLLESALGERIDLKTALAPDLWPVLSDPGDVSNVLFNLVLNARDAMPEGGTITIGAGNVSLDAAQAKAAGDTAPGDYVCVSVDDDGQGMSAEVLDHAKDPFFSTKSDGTGTGLGLFSVQVFARQSGGSMTIESVSGSGTKVRVYLPRTELQARPAVKKAVDQALPPGRGETILVVEDDDILRRTAHECLTSLGFRTRQAATSAEAIACLEAFDDISLVFSDIVMPGKLDGFDLAMWVQRERPGIPVVLTSGYQSEVDRLVSSKPGSSPAIVPKPYSLAELAAAVQAALRPA